MKTKLTQPLVLLAVTAAYGLSSCDKKKDDHEHGDGTHVHEEGAKPDDDKGHEHADGDGDKHDDKHDDDKGHEHDDGDKHDDDKGDEHADDDHDHDHAHNKKAGPNGGRVLIESKPHAEFFVTDDRKVQITFVDDDFKPVVAGDQVVTAHAGDRAAPTTLSFTKVGDTLVSDKALPAGDDFPIVVMIKAGADGDTAMAKFQCNLKDCPTCDFKEYACTCDHDHGDE